MTALWELPGPRRFCRVLAEDVLLGHMPIVVSPGRPSLQGLPHAVRSVDRGSPPEVIALGDLTGPSVGEALVEVLGIGTAAVAASPCTLLAEADLEWDVLWIDARQANDEAVNRWTRFVGEYLGACAERARPPRNVLVTWASPHQRHLLPRHDGVSPRRSWWNVVDRIDTAVHVDAEMRGHAADPIHVASIVEVAAWDLELASFLAALWDGSHSSLQDLLTTYAEEQALPQIEPADVSELSGAAPKGGLAVPWDAGIVEAWDGHVPCWHRTQEWMYGKRELERLVWRGQVGSAMSLVEQQRLRLAELLVDEYGLSARLLREDVGDIVRLYDALDVAQRYGAHAQLAQWVRRTRNHVAHLKPVDPEMLAEGRRLIAKIP